MNNKLISVIYGLVLALMITAAYLVAADVVVRENALLVAALAAAVITAIVIDIIFLKSGKRSSREIAVAGYTSTGRFSDRELDQKERRR